MAKMYTEYVSTLREDKRQQQRTCAFVSVLCCLLAVTIILIIVTVSLRYTGSRDVLSYSSTVGDTRLISYSAPLCQGGEMNVGIPLSNFVGYMYFLDEEPALSTSNNLVLAGTLDFSQAYNEYDFYGYDFSGSTVYASWLFHLHPGSVINAQSCILASSGGANFLVIQGSANYDRWTRGPLGPYYAYEAPLQPCLSGQNPPFSFFINEEGYYYVVYYTTSGTPSVLLGLTLNRTQYSTTAQPSCSLAVDGACSAESSSSTRYVLFQTGNENNFTYTSVQPFTLEWSCNPNNGVYAAIFFVPLIGLSLLLCGCFCVICACSYFMNRH